MPASLASLALSALLTLSPLASPRETLPGWEESETARATRYASIAGDISQAATDACGERGEGCRRWAAATLLGLAWHESNFALDTESPGGCYRGRDGRGPRCDGGRAATIWQMQGSADERALWLGDRVAAAREALRRAARSTNACRGKLPSEEALTAYAGGTCTGDVPRRRARELDAAIRRAAAVLPR